MRKLINLSLLLYFLIAIPSEAQDIIFKTGSNFERKYGRFLFNTSLRQGYFVTNEKGKFVIKVLEDYINPVAQKTIASESKAQQDAYLEGNLAFEDKNFLVYSVLDEKADNITVYSQELSGEMVLLGAPLKLANFKGGKAEVDLAISPYPATEISLSKSANNSLFVLVKEEDHKVDVTAFNQEMKYLWSTTFELEHKLDFDLKAIKVADDGNLFILGTYFKETFNEVTIKDPFVLVYSPTSQKQKIHTLAAENKISHVGYMMELLGDQTLFLAGLFYEKKQTSYHLSTINNTTLELETISKAPLKKEYSDLTFEKAYNPEYFSVQRIVQLENGNIVFAIDGGLSKSLKYLSTSYGTAAYVVAVNKEGTEIWNTIINKYQIAPTNGSLVGHFFFKKGNRVYLTYNDHPDNFNLAPTEKQKEVILKNKIYIATVEIDEEGKAKKVKLISTAKDQVSWFYPNEVIEIDPRLYHFQLFTGKSNKLGTLSTK